MTRPGLGELQRPPQGPGAKPASHSGGGGLGSRGQHCGSGCNVAPGPPSSRPVPSSGIIGPSPGTVGTLGAWRGWGKTPELPRLRGQALANRTDLRWKRRVGQGSAKRVKGQPEAALEIDVRGSRRPFQERYLMSSSTLQGLKARALGYSSLFSHITAGRRSGEGWRAGAGAQGARLGLTCWSSKAPV